MNSASPSRSRSGPHGSVSETIGSAKGFGAEPGAGAASGAASGGAAGASSSEGSGARRLDRRGGFAAGRETGRRLGVRRVDGFGYRGRGVGHGGGRGVGRRKVIHRRLSCEGRGFGSKMICDPWIATTSRASGERRHSGRAAHGDRIAARERPGQHVGEAGRGRKADLGQGERRKTFAADRPPEGLRRKGAPAPEAAGGEKGRGNLAADVAGEDARRRPVLPGPCPWLSEAEAPARAAPRLAPRSAPTSLAARAPREARPRPPRTRRRSARVPAAASVASPSPTKMARGNDRPTPSTEGMNAPIIASPQKSAPSQKRQIGARL